MTLRTFTNDNLLMRSVDEIETVGLELSPQLKASITSETWRYELDTTLDFNVLEDDEFNSEDQDVNFSALKITPTTRWQFTGRVDRATTRNTEFESVGLVEVDSSRREAHTFRPSVLWAINPKNSLTLGITTQNVHYDSLSFQDFDYYAADVTWGRQMTEHLVLELSASGSLFESESFRQSADSFVGECESGVFVIPSIFFGPVFRGSGDFESETYALQLGFRNMVSENFSFGGSVGRRKAASSNYSRFCNILDPLTLESFSDDKGTVVDARVDYAGENFTINAAVSRALDPSGLGFLIETTDLRFSGNYRFSEMLSGKLALSWFDKEGVESGNTFDRSGVTVQPWVEWRFTERLNLLGGVRYRTVDTVNTPERRGLKIFVGARYDFKPWTLSR